MKHSKPFRIVSEYKPSGDQPTAIKMLLDGINQNKKDQVLLGITGSGKTFTVANVIAQCQSPALIMSHNKTLAAQIYSEMKSIFPDNAVEYFVSYYDYYQPEAYIAKTDTYIEKDASINEQIDRMRHSATRSLLERNDVIVVSSISCIYGIGSPSFYSSMTITMSINQDYDRNELISNIFKLQYKRNDIKFERGNFRVSGEVIDIFPSYTKDRFIRFIFFGDELEEVAEYDSITGNKICKHSSIVIYPNSHYVTPKEVIDSMIPEIKNEMIERVEFFRSSGKFIEAERIEKRTLYDIEMLRETGSCKGIENYSRYFTGGKPGEPPPTLFEYLPKNAILFVDESHVSIPQIMSMYNGDRARKSNLIEHGFRLTSAFDNRPLKFDEWDALRPKTILVSATPSAWELEAVKGKVVEQVIRPTGLLDPECIIRPIENQVEDLISEIKVAIQSDYRILVTTLTKKMAEDLTKYLQEIGIKASYLHSDIHTLERVEILEDLRSGEIDVLIGINLLREGLDIPECALVAILDADKEGFLRSEVSLIQTIGRVARNANGRVILYADVVTNSIKKALRETSRRRKLQETYNIKMNIVPQTIAKKTGTHNISSAAIQPNNIANNTIEYSFKNEKELLSKIKYIKKEMFKSASNMEFEHAAALRDELKKLEKYRI